MSSDIPKSGGNASGNDAGGREDKSPYQTRLSQAAAADQSGPLSGEGSAPDLKTRWQALTARQKLRAKQAGVVAAIAVLGYGLYSASSAPEADKNKAPAASKLDMGAGLRGDSLELKLRGDLQKVLDGQNLLGDRISAIEEGKVLPGTRVGRPVDVDGNLPVALPGAAPNFPEPPSDADIGGASASLPDPPGPPPAPAAPPAPPVEKTIGSIGAATSAIIPAADKGSGANGSKKRTERSIYRLVS